MADTVKPTIIHRDHYLDARLPAWGAAEKAGLVRFEPITRAVEIFDALIAQRADDYLRYDPVAADNVRRRKQYTGTV